MNFGCCSVCPNVFRVEREWKMDFFLFIQWIDVIINRILCHVCHRIGSDQIDLYLFNTKTTFHISIDAKWKQTPQATGSNKMTLNAICQNEIKCFQFRILILNVRQILWHIHTASGFLFFFLNLFNSKKKFIEFQACVWCKMHMLTADCR